MVFDKIEPMQQTGRTREIRWMYAILLLSVSLLLMAVAFTFRIFSDTSASFDQIEKSNAIISSASAFETNLFQTESKIRLSIITKNISNVNLEEEHNEGKAKLGEIGKLTTNGIDIAALDSANKLLDDRFLLWTKTQQLMADSSSGQYLATGLAAHGSYISAHIAGLIAEIRRNEKRILNRSIESTKYGIIVISAVLMASALFSVAFILFAFRRLHGEIKNELRIQTVLQKKILELDRSNAHLERFAYTASHDLQEPLRKLHAFSEKLALQEKGNLSPEGGEIIDRMQKFVMRMQQLINDLLLFSRIISDKVAKTPVDLNKVLSEVKQNMSENIQKSGALISSGHLPEIMGYESQLRQLFQNIISNSIRYAKKDVPVKIGISTSVVTGDAITGIKAGDENKKFNLLIFSDNGIGFDNKYAEKIFEIFQRLHGKSEYEGTGIGLAICKLVTENHDGYIRASGMENRGANMMVYLPVA